MHLLSRLQGGVEGLSLRELVKTTEGLENWLDIGLRPHHLPIYLSVYSDDAPHPPRFSWAASWPIILGLCHLLLGHPRKLSSDSLPWAPPRPCPQPLLPQPTRLPWCSALPLGVGWGKLEARAGGTVLLFIAFVSLALLC